VTRDDDDYDNNNKGGELGDENAYVMFVRKAEILR
jgi:hypothetical protein